jgi:hypothetical protein
VTVRTFWTQPTGEEMRWLRRYVREHAGGWDCANGWHQAMVPLGVFSEDAAGRQPDDHDTGWPVECDKGCGYQFTDDDHRQVFASRMYRRLDTGEQWPIRELPPGAMYDADWMGDWAKGPDGICLVVILPSKNRHPWTVDSEASNCTRKGDRNHKCWIRHGDPRTGNVHVDKNGDTCQAGAGSIAADGWHGFLHHGELTP